MNIFLSYILLGLSLAAPIGPINAAQLDHGLKNGFLHSWFVGLGAMIADAIFMLLIFFGVVHFLEIPFMQTFLWLFGAFVLIYTGVESIVNISKINPKSQRSNEPAIKSFFTGFFMSLLNPLSILFWLGIYGSILTTTIHKYGREDVMLFSLAIFIGIFIWDISMATISSIFRKYLSITFLKILSIISGLFLIGFGVFFGLEGVQALVNK
ncbi:LysE family translocator [Caldibacillus lycopersici]|uniref:LysE family translocator n=1 Tax=Perspicuibacillus lycopersici TaxID=1325689 RepID=A0AAE3ISH9_9BACI|nr:LysE family translocator [Perspicuibacillus lycopersici]MCU9613597.1 LysE family translocator [Perspicuibacillus lycopersici]